jgi:predicted alpha/beta superfamily hydrolase
MPNRLLSWICVLGLVSPWPLALAQPAQEAALPAYQLADTEVLPIPAPALGRVYEAFVALPKGYAQSNRRYPVVYVTDAAYAFPLVRAIAARVRDHGVGLEDFILVGLSYAKGDSGTTSRNRDYTPTDRHAKPGSDERPGAYGQAAAYLDYLRTTALPAVERRYRADPGRRIYVGHSYGSLLGIHALLTEPTLFSHYVLGSPSLWYDDHRAFEAERRYASTHRQMPAQVRFYIGSFEQIRKGVPRYDTRYDMVGDLARFVAQMRSHRYQGLNLQSQVLGDEDHATVFPALITRGLMWALPKPTGR